MGYQRENASQIVKILIKIVIPFLQYLLFISNEFNRIIGMTDKYLYIHPSSTIVNLYLG